MAEKKKYNAGRGAARRGKPKNQGSAVKNAAEERENRIKREICGIISVMLGILLSIFCYPWGFEINALISKIVPAFFGVFGTVMYAAPILLIVLGVYLIASAKKRPRCGSIICAALFFPALSAVIQVFTSGNIAETAFGEFIKKGYANGALKTGGGLMGAFTAYPLLKLAGKAGAAVILIVIMLICIVAVTHISIRETARETARKLRGKTDEKRERREKRKADDIGIKYVGDNDNEAKDRGNETDDTPFMKHSGKPLTAGDSPFGYDAETNEKVKYPEPKRKRENVKIKKRGEEELELYPISGAFESVSAPKQRRRKQKELDWKPGIVGGLNPFEAGESREGSAVSKDSDISGDCENFEIPINISSNSFETDAEPVSLIEEAEISRSETESARETEAAGAEDTEKTKNGISETAKNITCSETGENKITTEIPPAVREYQRPPFSLLKTPDPASIAATESPNEKARILLNTLESFNIQARITNISIGPVITRFELQPAQGIRVSKITTLSNDIALALAASRVRIEAPIPGKSAIGIEIPNKEVAPVLLREVLETREFNSAKSPLTFALGKDIAGNVVLADLEKMPHMLIAGQTGSGKSVCINGIILSLVYKSSPKNVRMILIDPKVVELSVFSPLPHLFCPIVTEPKKAAGALKWAVSEMEQRYAKMGKVNARDINRYNSLQESEDEKWPRLVIIIDELSDLMMVASKDVEESICRLAQLGRACGIHLIVATQRPSVDVITGLIKANIPSRIAFAVSSLMDSRVILDMAGAEKLLGRGDMLFHANGAHKPVRAQGAYISDEEVETVMGFFTEQTQGVPAYEKSVLTEINLAAGAARGQGNGKQEDELLPDAVRIFIDSGTASISMLQRRLRVGYARAARLVDIMEQKKYISEPDGAKPRKVLIDAAEYARVFGENTEGTGEGGSGGEF